MPWTRAAAAFGGEVQLQKAVDAGEARVEVVSNVRVVKWSEGKHVSKKGGPETIEGGVVFAQLVFAEQRRVVFAQLKQIGWAPSCSNAELRQLEVKHEVPKPLQAKFDTATKAMQKTTKEALGVFADLNQNVSHDKAADVKSPIKHCTKELQTIEAEFKGIVNFGEDSGGTAVTWELCINKLQGAATSMEKLFDSVQAGKTML